VPRGNEKDLGEVPEEVRADLEFVIVETMDEVLEHALERASPDEAALPAAAAAPEAPIPPAIPADPPPGQYAH
jgi:ATP-dependent Lon protease